MTTDTVIMEYASAPAPTAAAPGRTLADRLRAATPLQLALLLSLLLHVLLLTVQLATPGSAPRRWVESKLEVILVNARDTERPLQAQALAQANLRGGGDGAAQERAQSPLPPSDELSIGDSATETRRRVQALQVEQQQLLAALRRDLARLPVPDVQTDAASPEGRALVERRRLLLQQMAELERRVNEHNAPPRQRYVSPATQEVVYAAYYDRLRRRIEARGTQDFPQQGGRKLYGQLTMNISVDAAGRVIDTEVVEPSGQPALDSRAAAIVRAASPFGAFSKAMRADAEVLVLSARFTFDRDQGVQAELRETVAP
jgi:protein TonB